MTPPTVIRIFADQAPASQQSTCNSRDKSLRRVLFFELVFDSIALMESVILGGAAHRQAVDDALTDLESALDRVTRVLETPGRLAGTDSELLVEWTRRLERMTNRISIGQQPLIKELDIQGYRQLGASHGTGVTLAPAIAETPTIATKLTMATKLTIPTTGVGALHHLEQASQRATPALIDVLSRYPLAPTSKSRVGQFMRSLDTSLRSR